MDQNFQTSFIPQKPIVKERAVSSRPVGFFVIISLFVLFTVLIATGGLFFYKNSLESKIVEMEKALTLARNRFEPAKITELQVLDKRLKSSGEILSKHITVTPIFEALEVLTLKTVRYTKFSYAISAERGLKIEVKMSGVALGYRALALQSDLFATKDIGKNLIDPVFSNLTLDNNGNVVFDLDFSVDPDFVNYKGRVAIQS